MAYLIGLWLFAGIYKVFVEEGRSPGQDFGVRAPEGLDGFKEAEVADDSGRDWE